MKHFFEQLRLRLREGDALTWGVISFCAVLTLSISIVSVLAIRYNAQYRGRIFPGVHIGTIPVGGMTPEQAEQAVQTEYDRRLPEALRFTFRQQTVSIPLTTATETEALATFLVHDRVEDAYKTGRQGFILSDAYIRFRAYSQPLRLPEPELVLQTEAIQQRLSPQLNALVVEPQEPQIKVLVSATSSSPVISLLDPIVGETYELTGLEGMIRAGILSASSANEIAALPITTKLISSRFTREEALPLLSPITQQLGIKTVRFTAERNEWIMNSSTRAKWYTLTTSGTELMLTLDTDALRKDIEPLIKPFLREPVDGYLELESNTSGTRQFKAFTPPVEGVGFDINELRDSVLAFYQEPTSTPIQIPLKRIQPKIEGEAATLLGIREALGTGRSNFAGSPTNRRYNINLGKKRVHGTLVAPGEEFSMLHTLGPVDGAHGWLPELVIKGNKTTPEYGGGLCQIGTTAFRTALESGFPITERRNHSYRVRYYEPAGTDATIYEPAPDFKFRNDTDHWILITGDLQGNDVSFTIWGTKDGRTASYTKPRVYNIVAPPPMKIIETLELSPGKTKCTETAHAGADADFNYTVTYANGEVKKTNFFSRYKPWQAVCLKGVAQLSQTDLTDPGIDQTGINNLN